MTLPLLVRRSLRQHLLSTTITAGSIALAGGLLMAVWNLKDQSRRTFESMTGGWDAVVGARSSKLQLVLNAIFHLEASPGNISGTDIAALEAHPMVAQVVPLAMGDNYQGFRIVGTTTPLFTDHEYRPGHKYRLQGEGTWFEDGYQEAVVGAFAARRLGWTVGTTFRPYHGLFFEPDRDRNVQHEEEYVVVGILEPTSTPADKVIWIPLAGIQHMTGHDPAHAEEVSAALVKLRDPSAGFRLDQLYNRQGDRLTFAWPIGAIMAQLFDKIGWFERVLALVGWLVAAVACGSVLASIYNSMQARRRDIAILRALGARRRTIFAAIVLEATAIASVGMIVAFAAQFLLLSLAAAFIRRETGVVIDPLQPHAVFLWAPLTLIGLSALAGCIPAWKAYRMDVATSLTPDS
jgi:putative ABC transport system permease protein